MPSPETLNVAALLEPINGPDPAGYPVDYTEFRAQFKELTTEHDPEDYPAGTPGHEMGVVKADWRKVVDLATRTLTRESKDLEVAARLTQALTKQYRFAGLRDGLQTIRQLVEQCWDRLHPALHDGSGADRADVLTRLLDANDPNSPASFPEAVRHSPFVDGEVEGYGYFHLDGAGRSGIDQDDAARAVARASFEQCKGVHDDVLACLAELDGLDRAVTERLGESFAMVHLRKALQDCAGSIARIVEQKGGAAAESPSREDSDAVGARSASGEGKVGGPPRNREAVFRQLEEAARTLEQLEPGSPVPYLIRRAVRLGKLPFPQLVRALLHEQTNVHVELDRLLGLADETASST